MKTVKIAESFTGYPQGAKEGSQPVEYLKGQEVEVNDAFAELIVGKGHATLADVPAKASSRPTSSTVEPAKDAEK